MAGRDKEFVVEGMHRDRSRSLIRRGDDRTKQVGEDREKQELMRRKEHMGRPVMAEARVAEQMVKHTVVEAEPRRADVAAVPVPETSRAATQVVEPEGTAVDTRGLDKMAARMAERTSLEGNDPETKRMRPDGTGGFVQKRVEHRYRQELTVRMKVQAQEELPILELLTVIRFMAGGLLACRQVERNEYEVTLTEEKGKINMLKGFKVGDVEVMVTDLCVNEVMVSFMKLPAYINDNEILDKLRIWGVTPTSAIRRRMWPGTNVADGTRFVKVKFEGVVKSLPYSAKFATAQGPQFFRVLHNGQFKSCRLCLDPEHLMKDCPQFFCYKCKEQGHYSRDCTAEVSRCQVCQSKRTECICNESKTDEELSEIADDDNMVNDSDVGGNDVESDVEVRSEQGGSGEESEEEEGEEEVTALGVVVSRSDATVQETETVKGPAGGASFAPDSLDKIQFNTEEVLARSKEEGRGVVKHITPPPKQITGLQTKHKSKSETKLTAPPKPPDKPQAASEGMVFGEDRDLFDNIDPSQNEFELPSYQVKKKDRIARGAKTFSKT